MIQILPMEQDKSQSGVYGSGSHIYISSYGVLHFRFEFYLFPTWEASNLGGLNYSSEGGTPVIPQLRWG